MLLSINLDMLSKKIFKVEKTITMPIIKAKAKSNY